MDDNKQAEESGGIKFPHSHTTSITMTLSPEFKYQLSRMENSLIKSELAFARTTAKTMLGYNTLYSSAMDEQKRIIGRVREMIAAEARAQSCIVDLSATRAAQAAELARLADITVKLEAQNKEVNARNEQLVKDAYRDAQKIEQMRAYAESVGAFIAGYYVPIDGAVSPRMLIANQQTIIHNLQKELGRRINQIETLDASVMEANKRTDAVRARHNKATVHVMLLKRQLGEFDALKKEHGVALNNIAGFESYINRLATERNEARAELKIARAEDDFEYIRHSLWTLMQYSDEARRLTEISADTSITKASQAIGAVNLFKAYVQRVKDQRSEARQQVTTLDAENIELREKLVLNNGDEWRNEVSRVSELQRKTEQELEREKDLRSKAQTIIQYITGMMGDIDLEIVKTIFDKFQNISEGEYSYSVDTLVSELRQHLAARGCVDTGAGFEAGRIHRKPDHFMTGGKAVITYNDGSTSEFTTRRGVSLNNVKADAGTPPKPGELNELAPSKPAQQNFLAFERADEKLVALADAVVTYACGCNHRYAKDAQIRTYCGTHSFAKATKGVYE